MPLTNSKPENRLHSEKAPALRILHVANRLNDKGDGIANVCVDIACEQAARGNTVAVACASGGFVPLIVANGVTHHPVDFRKRALFSLLGAVRRLRTIVRTERPDVVHAHTMTSTIVARLACLGRNTPVVATVHNEYQRGVILMGVANRVIGVSDAVSKAMMRRGIASRRVSTVRNGTVGSVRRAYDPATVNIPTLANPSIVAIGAVSERKGADLLIAAFGQLAAKYPTAELYFVGNVDWNEVHALSAATGVDDRIHFVGFHAQPQVYLRVATVFVLASRRDPFPLALLEALEAGTPIVANDVDGVSEALDNGTAGIIVAPGRPTEIADAVGRLFDSADLREQYSSAGALRSSLFSVSRMVDDYDSLYSHILTKGPARS